MRSGLDNLLACRSAFVRVACLLIAACVGGCAPDLPRYRPFSQGGGYSETVIAPNVFEVSYDSAHSTASSEATWFATVRAAELAVQRGSAYFRIVQVAHDSRIRTIITPPSTTIDTTGVYDRDDHLVTEWQTYRTDPGSEERYFVPTATILVEFHDTPADGTLEAVAILRAAEARGVPLSAETVVRLSRSVTQGPTTSPATKP